MENSKGITVNVFELETGLTTYENCEYVRIPSQNLLIMLDHAPIIGDFKGSVDIKYKNEEIHYNNIIASYMNSKNVFNLMIQGEENENSSI